MKYRFDHNNINVFDLEKSVAFYQEALGLQEVRRKSAPDGSFTLIFMGDGTSQHQLELTWLRDRKERYNLGDNESHICFRVDDFVAAKQVHKDRGFICFENPAMNLYFIEDPDGYWIEILPGK